MGYFRRLYYCLLLAFTRAEIEQEFLSLESRAKQSHSPDFELPENINSLSPLPQLQPKAKGDRVGPRTASPPSFTTEQNERILRLAYAPRKYDTGWQRYFSKLNTQFPGLTDKAVRKQLLYLAMRYDYDVDCKLLSAHEKISSTKKMQEPSLSDRTLAIWPKVVSELKKSLPNIPYDNGELWVRFHKFKQYIDNRSEFTVAAEQDIMRLSRDLESGSKLGQWQVALEEFKKKHKGYDWCKIEYLQSHYLHLNEAARGKAKEP